MELKAKCISNYSEFEKDKIYRMIKEDYMGVKVYINKYDHVTFTYADYTFYFTDIMTHRDNILNELLK